MGTLPLSIDSQRCIGCGECARACPFGALNMREDRPVPVDRCRACGACVKVCPVSAIEVEDCVQEKTAGNFRGILVYLQTNEDGNLLPVAFELACKAAELAESTGEEVYGLIVTTGMRDFYDRIPGIGKLFVALGKQYCRFSHRIFSDAVIRCISRCMPSAVLFGATPEGRSIAPAAAVHFRTGLTADCTELRMDKEGSLIQIRPAFGGNVMAEIITPSARPQMATVRPGVMAADCRAAKERYNVEVLETIPAVSQTSRVVGVFPVKASSIAEAEFIVVAGGGLSDKGDVERLQRWAVKHGAVLGCSRKLVERGWLPGECQIGLSGSSVAPKLLVTVGVSGSVQFLAGIRRAEYVVAINDSEDAPIFGRANEGILADLYDVLQELEKEDT